MSYIGSYLLGKQAKKFISIVLDESHDKTKTRKNVDFLTKDKTFTASRMEILEYLSGIKRCPKIKNEGKVLDMVIETADDFTPLEKKLLLTIMEKQKNLSEKVAGFFKTKGADLLTSYDIHKINQSSRNKNISNEDYKDIISNIVTKELNNNEGDSLYNAVSSEILQYGADCTTNKEMLREYTQNPEKLGENMNYMIELISESKKPNKRNEGFDIYDFEDEENINILDLALDIKKSKSKSKPGNIVVSYITNILYDDDMYSVDASDVFNKTTQRLLYTALNDSKIDEKNARDLFFSVTNQFESVGVNGNDDYDAFIDTIEVFAKSPAIYRNRENNAYLSALIKHKINMNAFSDDEISRLDEITAQNIQNCDPVKFASEMMDYADDYQKSYDDYKEDNYGSEEDDDRDEDDEDEDGEEIIKNPEPKEVYIKSLKNIKYISSLSILDDDEKEVIKNIIKTSQVNDNKYVRQTLNAVKNNGKEFDAQIQSIWGVQRDR